MTSTCLLAAYPNLVPRAFPNFKGKSPVSFSSMSMVQCVKCSNHAFSFELLPNVQDEFCFYIYFDKGENGECRSTKPHRSAPGGSGAGGSIVIITKTLHGNPHGRIFIQGGAPVKCALGTAGGKSTVIYPISSFKFFCQR